MRGIWNWAFDPIGLRIGLGKQKLAADLTVLPLIVASQYNQFTKVSRGREAGPRPAIRTRPWRRPSWP